MRKRSITLKGHRTSISLEDEFWETLDALAAADERSLPKLIYDIDRARMKQAPPPGLASALRVYVLRRVRNDVTT
ncbi:MAG: ribbon-helix-helix domain-containing protein [Pseudomonadota bacterium]